MLATKRRPATAPDAYPEQPQQMQERDSGDAADPIKKITIFPLGRQLESYRADRSASRFGGVKPHKRWRGRVPASACTFASALDLG
jgi:hypothetical protein